MTFSLSRIRVLFGHNEIIDPISETISIYRTNICEHNNAWIYTKSIPALLFFTACFVMCQSKIKCSKVSDTAQNYQIIKKVQSKLLQETKKPNKYLLASSKLCLS